jgi:hypothetical protein
MSDKIAAIFSSQLPTVDAADAFAKGMCAYHIAYKVQRDGAMNYADTPEYYNSQPEIMLVKQDDFWVHTPQFRKVMALAIGELFKTKVTMFSAPATVGCSVAMLFIDVHFNRWLVSISESAAGQIRVYMRFPIANTKVSHAVVVEEGQMCSPTFNASDSCMMVQDANAWHE